jgi:hypothetical protein
MEKSPSDLDCAADAPPLEAARPGHRNINGQSWQAYLD